MSGQSEDKSRVVGLRGLVGHSSIQMTERYAHLAPDYLHDAVASLGFAAQFQHSEETSKKVVGQNGLKAVENGGRGWI